MYCLGVMGVEGPQIPISGLGLQGRGWGTFVNPVADSRVTGGHRSVAKVARATSVSRTLYRLHSSHANIRPDLSPRTQAIRQKLSRRARSRARMGSREGLEGHIVGCIFLQV